MHLLVAFLALALARPVLAAPVVAFQSPIPPGGNGVFSPEYRLNRAAGEAWLLVDVDYSYGGEDPSRPVPFEGRVEGMYLDQSSNKIFWNGVDCADVSPRSIRATGKCVLRGFTRDLPISNHPHARTQRYVVVTIEAR